MSYEIEPYEGVGPIRLGMTREEVHALILAERKPALHRGAEKPGDWFPTLGLFVDYRAPGVCEFLEFVGPLAPTFQGQTFLGQPYRQARGWFEAADPACELEVNGGIDERTAPLAVAEGANVLVAGTSVFGANKTVTVAIEALREAISQIAQ